MTRTLILFQLCLFLLVELSAALYAQPGGFGGRGGRTGIRGPRGGIMAEIFSDEIRKELGITDEQFEKVQQIAEETQNNEQFGDVFERMRSAQSEEERQKIRDEMRAIGEKMREEAQAKVKEVLNDTQFKRLEQIQLHRAGTRAFDNEDVQKELNLTDAQKQQLAELQQQRDEARRELGFRASEEDRQKFSEEWDSKITSVLTPEQKQKWQERIGPPPTSDGRPAFGPGGPGGPGFGGPLAPPRRMAIEQEVPEGAEATVSFGAKPPEEGEKVPVEERKLSFNFRYAPWQDVLKLFAEQADLSLDLNALPPGTFNYYDDGEYSPTQALDILNGYLLPKGYCLVRRDEFLVCVNIDEAIPPNLIPIVTQSELDQRGNNELLTVIFPLEGVDVAEVAVEINEIKGPQGKVVGLNSTNSILVTDIGSNLRRIRNLLADVTAGGPDAVKFKSYPIQNISATDAESMLRSLMGIGGVPNVSASNERDRRSSSSSSRSGIQITTDLRTNQILVSATVAQHKLIEEALATIDVEGENSRFAPGANEPFLRVYSVNTSDAREVVKTIDALKPGVVVNEDGRNGKIHIFANQATQTEVEALIRQMDSVGGSQQMQVYPLSSLDPINATSTLRAMFLSDGEQAPTIEPDVYGRQLMVRGSADQLAQIKTLLTQLGEDGSGQRRNSQDRIRSFPISGRDPEEILPLIERLWSQQSETRIRIVTPEQRGSMIRGVRTPSEQDSAQREPVRQEQPGPQTSIQRPSLIRNASQLTENTENTTTENEESSPAQPTPQKTESQREDELADWLNDLLDEPAQQPKPQANTSSEPPTITVLGNDLMLMGDPAALDELEGMLESALQIIPPSTRWTVFTLQAADATETAMMLEQLFPSSSVSMGATSSGMLGSVSSSVSSLSSGLMEMTGLGAIGTGGQTLQIIPDIRLNSLFVSGPKTQVDQVEEMLKVLDANDWPSSFRDKYSRMIPIEHAEAQHVYDRVKETYSVYFEEQQNRQRNNGNPIASMFGGGSRGGGNQEAVPPAKLALSVDTNTNHLIVWADEELFREIETLVQELDHAAEIAKPTIQVIGLRNTNSAVMESALGTLIPRVNVSSTSSSRTSSSSTNNNNGPGGPPQSSDADRDRMRQFFEQRMRERSGGGGSPGGDSGGRPSFFGGGRPGGGSPFGGGRPGGDSGRGRGR